MIPGESLHDELELLVAAGAPRARVLRAATAGAAEHLGQRGTLGVVAAGARADLLLVDADPLAGPLPLVPAGVVLRGAWLSRADLERKLAAVARAHTAPPSPRWEGVPPLAAEGTDVHHAHYDLVQGGATIAEERLAIGMIAGGHVIVAQLVGDFGGTRVALQYRITQTSTSVAQQTSAGAIALDAKLDHGALVATGTDPSGAPLSLSQPAPAGAFLAGPGIGGSFPLADRLAGMKVGDQRTLASVELATYPRPGIHGMTHVVERKPDAGGLRVFAVNSKPPTGFGFDSELVLDERGGVVSQTFGPPLDFVYKRR